MADIPGFDVEIPEDGLPEPFVAALRSIFDNENPVLAEQKFGTVEFRVHYLNARKVKAGQVDQLEMEIEPGFQLASVQRAEGNGDDLILLYARQKPNARQQAILLIQQAVDVQFFRNLQQVLGLTANEQVRAVMAEVVDSEDEGEGADGTDFLAELEAMEREGAEAKQIDQSPEAVAEREELSAEDGGTFGEPLDESGGTTEMDPEDAKIVDEMIRAQQGEEENDGS